MCIQEPSHSHPSHSPLTLPPLTLSSLTLSSLTLTPHTPPPSHSHPSHSPLTHPPLTLSSLTLTPHTHPSHSPPPPPHTLTPHTLTGNRGSPVHRRRRDPLTKSHHSPASQLFLPSPLTPHRLPSPQAAAACREPRRPQKVVLQRPPGRSSRWGERGACFRGVKRYMYSQGSSLTLGVRMRSEGYSSRSVCVSVCVSVRTKSRTTGYEAVHERYQQIQCYKGRKNNVAILLKRLRSRDMA